MKQGNALIMLIASIVIIGLLVAPSIMSAGSDLLGGLSDFIREGLGGAGLSEGTHLTLTVEYVDGTRATFGDETGLPMTIYDTSDNEVSRLYVNVYVRPSFTGEASSWSATGDLLTEYRDNAGLKLSEDSKSLATGVKTTTLQTGILSKVKEVIYDASTIENAISAYGSGDYSMFFEASVTLNVNFAGGSQSASATGTLEWSFSYDDQSGQLTGIMVYVSKAQG